jgi:hypothetical protein
MDPDELTGERFLDWFNSRPCMAAYQAVEDAQLDLELADDSDALDDAALRLAQTRAVFDDAEAREADAEARALQSWKSQRDLLVALEYDTAMRSRRGIRVPRRARSCCGTRRRPGRRAVSRSAGGGSSGDPDEPEPERRHLALAPSPAAILIFGRRA